MKKLFCLALLACSFSFVACGSDNQDDTMDFDPIAIDFNVRTAALKKADSCDDYRKHILDAAARDIADARFSMYGRWYFYSMETNGADDGAMPDGEPGGDTGSDVPKDEAGEFTVTNIQEDGVDEVDTVKNDGTWMYSVERGRVIITRVWPAEDLEIVATIDRLDTKDYNQISGILLDGNTLIAIGYDASTYDRTTISVYDVSDPTKPKHLKTHQLDGWLQDARLINHRLHLVLSSYTQWNMLDMWDLYYAHIPGVPDFDWEDWDYDDWEAWEAKRKENIEKYLPIIRGWLEVKYPSIKHFNWPQYTSDGATRDLISCTDVYIPSTTSRDDGMLIVAEVSGEGYKDVHAQAITDYGWLIYASAKNLYVVSNSSNWYWNCDNDDTCRDYAHIHRFDLGQSDGMAKYVNSGEVVGNVTNQFWLSEYEGHLRVASTLNRWWANDSGSSLSVLKIDGAKMDVVGQIHDIGKGEYLYAARMFGPKGFMVTFLQTDPLFTFDLSDPTNPQQKGELKINGYSSYIHKMDDNTLLTIGEDATDEGRTLGMHLQVFDVSDMTNPERIQHVMINKDSENNYGWSSALSDHHAFNYHAGSGLLSIPVNLYSWTEDAYEHLTGAIVYKVSRDKGFEKLGVVNHADLVQSCNDWDWWTSMDRSRFYFKTAGTYDSDAYIYTISNHGIKVNNALNPSEEIGSVRYDFVHDPICDDDPVVPEPKPIDDPQPVES